MHRTKNYPVLNVNSAEVENPAVEGSALDLDGLSNVVNPTQSLTLALNLSMTEVRPWSNFRPTHGKVVDFITEKKN